MSVMDLEIDLGLDDRWRCADGDLDEVEALVGVCAGAEEKSHSMECFSQLEHCGLTSSH